MSKSTASVEDSELTEVPQKKSNAEGMHVPGCSYGPDNPRIITRQQAEREGYKPCQHCLSDDRVTDEELIWTVRALYRMNHTAIAGGVPGGKIADDVDVREDTVNRRLRSIDEVAKQPGYDGRQTTTWLPMTEKSNAHPLTTDGGGGD